MTQAQEAFAHLHELDWLEECDLRKVPAVLSRVDPSQTMPQAQALRSLLTDAAERVILDLGDIPKKSHVSLFLQGWLKGKRVSEIARDLGVSREHCSREFRKEAFQLVSEQFLRLASRSGSAVQ